MNLLSKLEFVNTVTRCSDVVRRIFGANTRATRYQQSTSGNSMGSGRGVLTQILRCHLCRVDHLTPHK